MIYVLIEQHHHWIIKYIGLYPCLLVADEDWSVLRVLWKSRKAQLYPFSALSAFKCNESWTISCQWVSCCLLRVSMVFPRWPSFQAVCFTWLFSDIARQLLSALFTAIVTEEYHRRSQLGSSLETHAKGVSFLRVLDISLPMLLKPS